MHQKTKKNSRSRSLFFLKTQKTLEPEAYFIKTQKFSRSRSLFFLKTQKTQKLSRPRSLLLLKTKKTQKLQHQRIINFFHIWQIQNLEQVYPVSVLILPASESLNPFFKNTIYCKKWKFACDLGFASCKKLKNSLVPEAYISLKLKKTQKYNFFHIWQIQNLEQVYPV